MRRRSGQGHNPQAKKSVEEKELVKENKEEPELESVQDIIF